MRLLLSVVAVIFVIAGIVQIFQGQILWGIALIVVGCIIGPGVIRSTKENKLNIAPLALLGGLIYALTTFARRLLPVSLNGWQTQLLGFLIGLGTIFLVSASRIVGSTVQINHVFLNDYDAASKVILGLLATGLFAVVPADLMKAIDVHRNSSVDSETKPQGPVTPQ